MVNIIPGHLASASANCPSPPPHNDNMDQCILLVLPGTGRSCKAAGVSRLPSHPGTPRARNQPAVEIAVIKNNTSCCPHSSHSCPNHPALIICVTAKLEGDLLTGDLLIGDLLMGDLLMGEPLMGEASCHSHGCYYWTLFSLLTSKSCRILTEEQEL